MYEASISIHQTGYSSTGNAWKVWDSSIVLARCFFPEFSDLYMYRIYYFLCVSFCTKRQELRELYNFMEIRFLNILCTYVDMMLFLKDILR